MSLRPFSSARNPYLSMFVNSLAPCRHILCLTCLQQWFRKAPPSTDDLDEMDIDSETDPEYTLNRPKSCPCCRAVVIRRPVPVFVVKAVAAALRKAKGVGETGGGSPVSTGSSSEQDPWKGLFPSAGDDDSSEGYNEDEDEDDEDEDVTEELEAWGMGLYAGLGGFDDHPHSSRSNSGSDEESGGGDVSESGWIHT